MFMIVDSVLLQPLRYRDSGRLVAVWEQVQTLALGPIGPNPRHVDFWTKRSKTIESFAFGAAGFHPVSPFPERIIRSLVGVGECFCRTLQYPAGEAPARTWLSARAGIGGPDSVAVLEATLFGRNSFWW